ncbi:ThuA domain-containing protein [Haloarcula sp. NS06]|uniref:ThuA domain-containing protein n=1 Tax=Haloarcula sp. NS06 TaxID=3409688 RepID=UPI003DA7103D
MVAVTVWNENHHERATGPAKAMYPNGIHTTLAEALASYGHTAQTATLDEPAHGLTEEVLAETDVLLWWGDVAHDLVSDATANRIEQAVRDGMGFIPLHSSHESKPFEVLMGDWHPALARRGRARVRLVRRNEPSHYRRTARGVRTRTCRDLRKGVRSADTGHPGDCKLV